MIWVLVMAFNLPLPPLHILNVFMPICPHLVGHPLFRQRLDLLHRRLVDVMARELILLMHEPLEEDLGVQEAAEAELVEEPLPQEEPDIQDDLETTLQEDPEVSLASVQLSDGCVTASETEDVAMAPEDNDTIVSAASHEVGRNHTPMRSELSSASRERALPMGEGTVSSSTKPVPSDHDTSSSDLPTFFISNRPDPPTSPQPHSSSHPPLPSPIPHHDLSTPSSHFSSVSARLPRAGNVSPPFPSPFANDSVSDIDSPSSLESRETGLSQRSRDPFRGPRQDQPRWRLCRHRSCQSRRRSVSRVARWLFQGCIRSQPSQDPSAPSGSPLNPILLLDSDSEPEH